MCIRDRPTTSRRAAPLRYPACSRRCVAVSAQSMAATLSDNETYSQKAAMRLAVAVPLLQVAERVDRAAALIPAGGGPDLEVQVTGGGGAGAADQADRPVSY